MTYIKRSRWQLPLRVVALLLSICIILSLTHLGVPANLRGLVGVHPWMALAHHPPLLPPIMGIPAVAGFALVLILVGVGTVAQRVWRTHQALRPLLYPLSLSARPVLQEMARAEGLTPVVILIKSPEPIVFCFGFWQPRILMSTGVVDVLTLPQLRAVLLHEDWHRQRRDPLRLLLADTVGVMFFFFPVLNQWRTRFRLQVEIEADRYSVRRLGKAPLAGALYQLLKYKHMADRSGLIGISASSLRIAALLEEPLPLPSASLRSTLISLIALGLFCLLFL